ncbi:MAG TPA: S8 family serine peptidase, partial [Pyrinomonadaceae bacterium]|nr:S8 family serine peptidase [Pyrinomonadaceae bacterium]
MPSDTRRILALMLAVFLCAGPASAGITVTGADGITVTGADGITVTGADGINYIHTSGITVTGADGILSFKPNGITGITPNGITVTGADGGTYAGANNLSATHPDGITVTGADGITVTGADGITVTGADGTRYSVDSVNFRTPNGITVTGADGITVTGADGIQHVGSNGITVTGADGAKLTKVNGITVTGADGITVTGADGRSFNISPSGITVTGADAVMMLMKPTGITMNSADGITVTGADTLNALGNEVAGATGLRSIDPELAILLNTDNLTDDSNINAVVAYHQMPTDSDILDLQRIGILGGTRYHTLPMIAITGTRDQIAQISKLAAVRSIYGNRTLQSNIDPEIRAVTGEDRALRDTDVTRKNGGLPLSGRNITVAVLDTGVDGTHSDISGRVVQNVKLADTQSVSAGFTYPAAIENLPNTDQAYGHGTFVAGVIAGNGAHSGGKYKGVASGAQILGLSAGDLTLSFVLSGFDYLLANGANYNARVVNCSFSANTVFDFNDPVNIATKILTDRGINVVFSAGNTGPGLHSLNPYAVAPWVISVGATDERQRIASFSSRGDFGSALFHPTLVAPGVNVVSLRASTLASVTGVTGIAPGVDTQKLSAGELPFYTTASGTSFTAPQVAGTIALMLEANPTLKPAQIRDILQRTATPLLPYYEHEVGAGMLNTHAAVLESAFAQRRIGFWRAWLDRGQFAFVNEEPQEFPGTLTSQGNSFNVSLSVPENTVAASVQVAWGPGNSVNDLDLYFYDPSGVDQSDGTGANQSGLTGRRERVIVATPQTGAWRAQVVNKLGAAGSAQSFTGVFELTRIAYAPLSDVNDLSATARGEIYQALRTYTIFPYGSNFRPNNPVSRLNLAAALVTGARVPQYLPAQSRFTDVRDATTSAFVESVQSAPSGALFYDASPGSAFRPDDQVTRLVAAVALVRALGLQPDATSTLPPTLMDSAAIPA